MPGTPHGYTKFAAYAALHHDGDLRAAARAARALKDGNKDTSDDFSWAGARTAKAADDEEDGPCDPPTSRVTLPDEFWAARAHLEHIRTAARARMCAPDAMFAAVLCRVVQHIDYRFVLPPIIGGVGTLNMLAVIVAPSGAGKGAASSASAELIRVAPIPGYRVGEAPAGSGEGLVHAFYERVTEKEGRRSVTTMKRRVEGLLVRCDEGQALTALASRQGQTTMETLRQAFSGELLGGSYSTGEKRVTLGQHDYRLTMLMAVQPVHARGLLDDWEGGTPQRFWWAAATDPQAPEIDDLPGWPGPLDWQPPSWEAGGETDFLGMRRGLIAVDDAIVREMRSHHRAVNVGSASNGRYDGHRYYVQLKIAAALAVLDGRLGVYPEDWDLAAMVTATSANVRQTILATIKEDAAATEESRHRFAARRAAAEHEARRAVDDNVARVAKTIARRVAKLCADKASVGQREVTQAVAARDRAWLDSGVDHAEAMGWVVVDEGRFSPGKIL